MRSNYNDEELAALAEINKLLAEDVRRMTAVVQMCLKHIVGCESADHRAAVSRQLGVSVTALLNHIRYCAWIEAEVTKTRAIPDPQKVLAEMIAAQEEVAAEIKAKQEGTVTDAASVPAEPPVEDLLAQQAAAMDALANVPLPVKKVH